METEIQNPKLEILNKRRKLLENTGKGGKRGFMPAAREREEYGLLAGIHGIAAVGRTSLFSPPYSLYFPRFPRLFRISDFLTFRLISYTGMSGPLPPFDRRYPKCYNRAGFESRNRQQFLREWIRIGNKRHQVPCVPDCLSCLPL